jgi:hypothetical protein
MGTSPEPLFVYAQLNARLMPLDRGERYEEPLESALTENGFGKVTGGGTMMAANREVDYCGIDVDLFDVENGIPFLCQFLSQCGAPKGSKLMYGEGADRKEVPFGSLEGLGFYMNGTDLPDEVYKTCDSNVVYDEINRLLGQRGAIQSYWQGPSETALYLYGNSAEEMRSLIQPIVSSYPLCQKARIVVIA